MSNSLYISIGCFFKNVSSDEMSFEFSLSSCLTLPGKQNKNKFPTKPQHV